MIKLENVVLASPEQMEFIIEGMRNPMNSWEKSDSEFCSDVGAFCRECGDGDYTHCNIGIGDGIYIGENDFDLMQRLADAGSVHRKYIRMMPVYVRITAPLYW